MSQIISNLQEAALSPNSLEKYVQANLSAIHDYFSSKSHQLLVANKRQIKELISLNSQTLSALGSENETNLAFLTLLLDVSERLGLLSQFQILYSKISPTNYVVGNRLRAASLYMSNVHLASDYLTRFDEFVSLLSQALREEEDTDSRGIATLVNYYAQALINVGQFNSNIVHELQRRMASCGEDANLAFTRHELVKTVVRLRTDDCLVTYRKIQELLDGFLGLTVEQGLIPTRGLLIESGTDYAIRLSSTEADFAKVRSISVDRYQNLGDASVFHSLQRGVKILTTEDQLYAYMNSYGRMHHAKLISAFEHLPDDMFSSELVLLDWACGQGLATMAFVDYAEKANRPCRISRIKLIEPSEVAIKRASLHVSKFSGQAKVETINKVFDLLAENEICEHCDGTCSTCNGTKLHMLSNILDVELFSLENLVTAITHGCKGRNYFVCVSPYITDLKRNRIDAFVQTFRQKSTFRMLFSSDDKQWQNWSRVVRVFEVYL